LLALRSGHVVLFILSVPVSSVEVTLKELMAFRVVRQVVLQGVFDLHS
jgi:hypothetical protein